FNHITKPSKKEKVLSYLQYISKQQNSKYFDIPFNRQELADYLSVDRSALSFELSKLKKQGILDFTKNHFMLK
ncbi:MAG: winged helix-turn-helix domain-containing protein, partial [Clostridia bacterium]|nr:winged helix-turn-helix domain-containing protein [Clostridia bacterium]